MIRSIPVFILVRAISVICTICILCLISAAGAWISESYADASQSGKSEQLVKITLTGIDFTPAHPEKYKRFLYRTKEDDGRIFYFHRGIRYYDGDVLTLHGKDEDGNKVYKKYLYDTDHSGFINELSSNDFIPMTDIIRENVPARYDSPKDVSGGSHVRLTYKGFTAQYPVEILTIRSMEYIPGEKIIVDVNDRKEPDGTYYCGDKLIKKGDVICLTDTDGTRYRFERTVSDDGYYSFFCSSTDDEILCDDSMPVSASSDQVKVPWCEGSMQEYPGNYLWAEFSGFRCKVPVTLTNGKVVPVAISCNPSEPYRVVENTNGGFLEEIGAFFYACVDWHDGDEITISYSDGTRKTYRFYLSDYKFRNIKNKNDTLFPHTDTFDCQSYNYNEIDLLSIQTREEPWTLGNHNHAVVRYAGVESTVPVEVVPNNVTDFEYIPFHDRIFVEKYSGGRTWEFYWDEESQSQKKKEYYCYWGPYLLKGDRIKVTYNDGRGVQTYISRDGWTLINERDDKDIINAYTNRNDYIEYDYNSSDCYETRWLPERHNSIKIRFRGIEKTIPAYVIPATQKFAAAYYAKIKVNNETGDPEYVKPAHEPDVMDMWTKYLKLTDDEKFALDYTTEGGPVPEFKAALHFRIKPAVTLSASSYTYDGKVHKPSVVVKLNKSRMKPRYYTVKYPKGCKDIGTYKVTVVMKGIYSGSGSASFVIRPKGTSIRKIAAGKKKITVKWKKQAVKTSGYQIQYSLKKNFKSGNKTVKVKSAKTTSKGIKKLKSKKKYFVRIRTYKKVKGKTYYSVWSKAKAVTVK